MHTANVVVIKAAFSLSNQLDHFLSFWLSANMMIAYQGTTKSQKFGAFYLLFQAAILDVLSRIEPPVYTLLYIDILVLPCQ